MNSGELSGNYAEVAGGGLCLVMIRISNDKTDFKRLNVVEFTLNNGTIYNNRTDGNGAGVYIMENKILAMLQELFGNSIPAILAIPNLLLLLISVSVYVLDFHK
jgi:hypothetical protein